jgi:hypothetical protein
MKSAVLRLGTTFAIGIAYGVAGFWFLDPREFGIAFSLREAVQNTLRALMLSGDPRVVPHTRHAAWFLDSLPLMTALMVSYSIALLFRPVLYRLRTVPQERAAATDIVRQHGRAPLDFFKLWPDKSLFFTLVEQLRWKSEVIVSDGRAYLISGDPALLSKVQEATRRFSEIISALRQQSLSAHDPDLGPVDRERRVANGVSDQEHARRGDH